MTEVLEREDLTALSDHELRWAIRDAIAVMYDHLGLKMEEEK